MVRRLSLSSSRSPTPQVRTWSRSLVNSPKSLTWKIYWLWYNVSTSHSLNHWSHPRYHWVEDREDQAQLDWFFSWHFSKTSSRRLEMITHKLQQDIDNSESYVDSGSYIFNALVSGSIFGGVSANKITAIAGESSTGKTFFSLAVVQNFLDSNPDGICLYFDTESAITRESSWVRDDPLTLQELLSNVVTIERI